MDLLGINWGYLLANIVVLAAWPISAIFALSQLRNRDLPEVARAIWAAVILVVPFLGVIAFWIVQPGKSQREI